MSKLSIELDFHWAEHVFSMDAQKDVRFKVLIIEDEPDIRELMSFQLTEAGLDVRELPNGNDFSETFESYRPDIVLVDQILPGRSGRDIINEIRGHSSLGMTPVMMVSALHSESDKVGSLEVGADDYLTKPFGNRELIARARALFRRSKLLSLNSQVIQYGDLEVQTKSHRVLVAKQSVDLTLTEYKILLELLLNQGQVLSRDWLREKALGNMNVTDRTIDVHMAAIRKKMGAMSEAVTTVRGVGYRLGN